MKHAKSGRTQTRTATARPPSPPPDFELIELSHAPLKTVSALRQQVAAIKIERRATLAGRVIAKGHALHRIGKVEMLFKQAYAAFDELQRDLARHETLRVVIVSIDKVLAGETVELRVEDASGAPGAIRAPAEPVAASPGLERARARGQKALAQWVKEGVLVPSPEFAKTWGVTRQALEQAVQRRALFSVKHAGRRYYPRVLLDLETESVAQICQALAALSSSEKLLFWLNAHGALRGLTPAQAVQAGRLERVVEHAAAWARERSATRVAEGGGRAVHG